MIDNEPLCIRVIGRVVDTLVPLFKDSLELNKFAENQVIVFCSHSAFDIPVGHSFTHIKDALGKEVFQGEFLLKNVTQQFHFPLTEIPHGWKTICKFEFGGIVPEVVKQLPKLDGWYIAEKYLMFCT